MKKILAYRFSAFGDVAMIVPVLKEFLAQNPNTEIIFVSRKNFADLFDGVERLTFRGVNLDDYKVFFGLRKLALELKKEFQFLSYVYEYSWYGEFELSKTDFERTETTFQKLIASK